MSRPVVLITGGGSGGHVFPGLAVADALGERGWSVEWAGARDGMEQRLVERHGLPFHALGARPLVGRGVFGRALALATLCGSAIAGRTLVRRVGARVVLGTGGYVSAPAAVGAWLARIPLVLLEPNAEPGVANRMLSRVAREVLLARPIGDASTSSLHCPPTVTGVPVRSEFFDVAPRLPFGAPLRLLVLGGSQGAKQLNELLPAAVDHLDETLGPILIRHQTGKRHAKAVRATYAERGHNPRQAGVGFDVEGPRIQIEVVSFLDDMASALAESHLVLSRAGAITLAELCAAGRPALLAPLALAGGHQEANARQLADAGAVEVLDAGADAEALARLLNQLLSERSRLERMAEVARGLGPAHAAETIADRLEHWAGAVEGPNGSGSHPRLVPGDATGRAA